MKSAIDRLHATFFEATTALAFKYFSDHGVEIAVIETGLGGRFDATNVLQPLVSVLTNISLEHTEYLGNTIRMIAREKAGIIKKGVPVVTSARTPEVLDVFRHTAVRMGSKFFRREDLVRLRGRRFFVHRAGSFTASLGLAGEHQRENAALAVAALAACGLLQKGGVVTVRAGVRGLVRVRENTGIRGRLEIIPGRPKILLDVAHNPAGVSTLIGALRSARLTPSVVIFGALKDKNFMAELRAIAALEIPVLCVTPRSERALPARALTSAALREGVQAEGMRSMDAALRRGKRIAGPGGRILVTGSHFVVGPALEALYGKKA